MAWTTPKTWADNVLVTVDDFNTHIRDNLDVLKNPPSSAYRFDRDSNYTTSSNSFVDVDAVDMALTVETGGGDIFVGFFGVVAHTSGGGRIYFDLFDSSAGTRIGNDDGLVVAQVAGAYDGISTSFVVRIPAPSAGSYTYRLQWKTSASTATLYMGAGTSNYNVHSQFWVRELS